jgi:hypothetical protein
MMALSLASAALRIFSIIESVMLSPKGIGLIKILEVGGVGAGRIFTESYDVKAEGGMYSENEINRKENLPTDTHPIL